MFRCHSFTFRELQKQKGTSTDPRIMVLHCRVYNISNYKIINDKYKKYVVAIFMLIIYHFMIVNILYLTL